MYDCGWYPDLNEKSTSLPTKSPDSHEERRTGFRQSPSIGNAPVVRLRQTVLVCSDGQPFLAGKGQSTLDLHKPVSAHLRPFIAHNMSAWMARTVGSAARAMSRRCSLALQTCYMSNTHVW
ncbi:hypothetical protein C0Q70_01168 [Pomacea canaliculata]|uniref:Uncharacterized protein n=1 Tax=Pomacea canaliculata TaxID=400727 RepID=A0A2T7PYP6_POMCA|nr:hypothetical protein C0Q70_01168 [Pomacea canaliculata]